MPRHKVWPPEVAQDTIAFLSDLASLPGRDNALQTGVLTAYDAHSFRLRIYKFRKMLLEHMRDPESEDAKRATLWAEVIIGPRGTNVQWWQLATFRVEAAGVPARDGKPGRILIAQIKRPVYGPDLVWDAPQNDDVARQLLARA